MGVQQQEWRYGGNPGSDLIGWALAAIAFALLYFAASDTLRHYRLAFAAERTNATLVAKRPMPTDRIGHGELVWRYSTSRGQLFDMAAKVATATYIAIEVGETRQLRYVSEAPATVLFDGDSWPLRRALWKLILAILAALAARPILVEAFDGRWNAVESGARKPRWYVITRVVVGIALLMVAFRWLGAVERPNPVAWEKTDGRVLGSWRSASSSRCRGTGCWLVYEFTDHHGRLIRNSYEGSASSISDKAGSPITVYYDRSDPAHAVPNQPPALERADLIPRLLWATGTLGLGIALLWRAYWVAQLAKARRRYPSLRWRHLEVAIALLRAIRWRLREKRMADRMRPGSTRFVGQRE